MWHPVISHSAVLRWTVSIRVIMRTLFSEYCSCNRLNLVRSSAACDASVYPGVLNKSVKSFGKEGITRSLSGVTVDPLQASRFISAYICLTFWIGSFTDPVLIFSSPQGHKLSDCLAGICRGQSSWYLTFLPTSPAWLSAVAWPRDSGRNMNWTLKYSAPCWQWQSFMRHKTNRDVRLTAAFDRDNKWCMGSTCCQWT